MGDSLEQQITAVVNEIRMYTRDITVEAEKVIKDVSSEAIATLKAGEYGKHTGKYRKSFRTFINKDRNSINGGIYSTRWQLTHLLENGHVVWVGKKGSRRAGSERTKAYPHWEKAEKFVEEELTKRLVEVVNSL